MNHQKFWLGCGVAGLGYAAAFVFAYSAARVAVPREPEPDCYSEAECVQACMDVIEEHAGQRVP